MKIFNLLRDKQSCKKLQENKPPATPTADKPNKVILDVCLEMGFQIPNIRRALVDLNGLKYVELEEASGISVQNLSRTVMGKQEHDGSKEVLANCLGLDVDEMFPDERG